MAPLKDTNCDFELVPGSEADYRCRRPECGLLVPNVTVLPIHARCAVHGGLEAAGPPMATPRAPSLAAGPGRELTGLIHRLGLREVCGMCELRASQMNDWGPDGCRQRVDEIVAWLRESADERGWLVRLRVAVGPEAIGIKIKALRLGRGDFLRGLVLLAIAEAERKTLTVFVLGHEQQALDAVANARHLVKVNLTEIESDCRLAESRVFLRGRGVSPLESTGGTPVPQYIGLATASWNRKYGPVEEWRGRKWPYCLPLERLDELELGDPKVVHCAALTDDEHWGDEGNGLDGLFPGCAAIVDDLIEHFGLETKHRNGPLANNFIAHRDVTIDHARWMRSVIEYLDAKHGPVWPVSGEILPCFRERLPAFAMECASILYFANRPELELRQIPSPK